jgi:UDP:flavonoid glycosyltransferase YjiC (YdhE family)
MLYVAPCGIGLGHVKRDLIVTDPLKDQMEIVYATYGEALELARLSGYRTLGLESLYWEESRDGSIDRLRTLLSIPKYSLKFLKQSWQHSNYIKRLRPRVILSDSSNAVLFPKKPQPILFLTNQLGMVLPIGPGLRITWRKVRFTIDRFLVNDLPGEYSLLKRQTYPIPREIERKTRIVGLIIEEKYKKDYPKKRAREKIGFPKDKPLIYVQISGPGKSYLSSTLVKILKDFEDFQTIVSLGNPRIRVNKQIGNVRLYSWVPSTLDYLAACDLYIKRPSLLTTTEAIFMRRKGIVVPLPKQTEQAEISKRLAELNLAAKVEQRRLEELLTQEFLWEQIDDKEKERSLKKFRKVALGYDAASLVKEEILGYLKN